MKLGQGYVFTGVCDSVNRGRGGGYLTPPQSRHPPPRADTPQQTQSRHPLEQIPHPPEQTPHPPGADTLPPPWQAWCEIWSMHGWYASYWNAILLALIFSGQWNSHGLGKGEDLRWQRLACWYPLSSTGLWKVNGKKKTTCRRLSV